MLAKKIARGKGDRRLAPLTRDPRLQRSCERGLSTEYTVLDTHQCVKGKTLCSLCYLDANKCIKNGNQKIIPVMGKVGLTHKGVLY